MDMSIPVILFLEWGGTALIVWGIWQLAFKSQPKKRMQEPIGEEGNVADEIKNLQRELRRL